MHEELFRPEALRALDQRWLGAPASRLAGRIEIVAALVGAIFMVLCLWSAMANFPRRIAVRGELVPSTGMIDLMAHSSGVITEIRGRTDAAVADGEVLFLLEPIEEPSRGLTAAGVAAAIEARLQQLLDERAALAPLIAQRRRLFQDRIALMRQESAAFGNQREEVQHQLQIGAQVLAAYAESMQAGIIAKVTLYEKQKELSALQERAAQLQADLVAHRRALVDIESERAAAMQQLAERHAAIDSEEATTRARLREAALLAGGEIRAPRRGRLTSLLVRAGQVVQANQALARLLPAGALLEARVTVPDNALGTLHVGQAVSLRLDAFPHQQFGRLDARLSWLSSTATRAAATERGPGQADSGFEALLSIPQEFHAPNGTTLALRPGMRFTADVVVQRRSVLRALFTSAR